MAAQEFFEFGRGERRPDQAAVQAGPRLLGKRHAAGEGEGEVAQALRSKDGAAAAAGLRDATSGHGGTSTFEALNHRRMGWGLSVVLLFCKWFIGIGFLPCWQYLRLQGRRRLGAWFQASRSDHSSTRRIVNQPTHIHPLPSPQTKL